MCYYTASYLKSQFCRPGGVFWPFLDPREAKNGKKKANRAKLLTKKITVKKNVRILATLQKKKSWLYDNQPQSYIRLLLVVFFVPTRYKSKIYWDLSTIILQKIDSKTKCFNFSNSFCLLDILENSSQRKKTLLSTVWRQKKPAKVNECSSVGDYPTSMIFFLQSSQHLYVFFDR